MHYNVWHFLIFDHLDFWYKTFPVSFRTHFQKQPIKSLYQIHKTLWLTIVGITISKDGIIYIADNLNIRKITPDGMIHTLIDSQLQSMAWEPMACKTFPVSFCTHFQKQPIKSLYQIHKALWLDHIAVLGTILVFKNVFFNFNNFFSYGLSNHCTLNIVERVGDCYWMATSSISAISMTRTSYILSWGNNLAEKVCFEYLSFWLII
jgi:hypothetical protein